ncbi:MAG: ROK family protein, partial [Streptomycetaceae bacterium]|nr:ROK family protein [Streptomycetaceae bacterium]
WAGTPIRAYLRAAFPGLAVAVDNDVNAMALGELRFGAAVGLDSVLYVSVGTGIGGAYAIGGRLVRGAHHAAGEIGHLVASGSRRCSCGGVGHVESVASGPAIEAAYAEACGATGPTGASGPTGPTGPTSATAERVGLREIVRRADAGDPAAAAVIAGAAADLGAVLGGLACAFDPQAVVLGGGVAGIGMRFTEPLARALRRGLLPAMAELPLLGAALGTSAPIVGAAALLDDAGITALPEPPAADETAADERAADGAAIATNEERP